MSEDLGMQVLGLMGENQELTNQMLRLQADFENFKRRTRQEREELLKYSNMELVSKLLPVLDNFERALETKDAQSESFAQGMALIYRLLIETLGKEGLQPMNSEGAEFDPNMHDAVMHEPSDGHEENAVICELQKGYLFKEKLLRPAMVKVCKK
jgi:molecular chaperone GrpE